MKAVSELFGIFINVSCVLFPLEKNGDFYHVRRGRLIVSRTFVNSWESHVANIQFFKQTITYVFKIDMCKKGNVSFKM